MDNQPMRHAVVQRKDAAEHQPRARAGATIICCSCFDRVAATGLARLEPARRLCTGWMGLETVDWRCYFSQRAASPTAATPIEVFAQPTLSFRRIGTVARVLAGN